jgi:hypothetical protein
MSDDRDSLYEEFRDLLGEVPEAEDAIREYRAHRQRQAKDAVIRRMKERERQVREAAWDSLCRQFRVSGGSDTVH